MLLPQFHSGSIAPYFMLLKDLVKASCAAPPRAASPHEVHVEGSGQARQAHKRKSRDSRRSFSGRRGCDTSNITNFTFESSDSSSAATRYVLSPYPGPCELRFEFSAWSEVISKRRSGFGVELKGKTCERLLIFA